MGLVEKSESLNAIQRASGHQDVEKQESLHQEHSEPTVQGSSTNLTTIDPEVERRVLKKLDLRVPTLMGFFCMVPSLRKVITYPLLN